MGAIVEVNDGKIWGRICVKDWTLNHGASVCKQHGYKGAIATLSVPFDVSTAEQTRVLINIHRDCRIRGNLNSVDCRADISADCECQNVTAGIICSKCYEVLQQNTTAVLRHS